MRNTTGILTKDSSKSMADYESAIKFTRRGMRARPVSTVDISNSNNNLNNDSTKNPIFHKDIQHSSKNLIEQQYNNNYENFRNTENRLQTLKDVYVFCCPTSCWSYNIFMKEFFIQILW